jgi:hypothetical protein
LIAYSILLLDRKYDLAMLKKDLYFGRKEDGRFKATEEERRRNLSITLFSLIAVWLVEIAFIGPRTSINDVALGLMMIGFAFIYIVEEEIANNLSLINKWLVRGILVSLLVAHILIFLPEVNWEKTGIMALGAMLLTGLLALSGYVFWNLQGHKT